MRGFFSKVLATGENPVPITYDFPIDRDIAQVTSEETMELPPAREKELAIEVLPNDTSIAERPFRMPLFEFQELKSQLWKMHE